MPIKSAGTGAARAETNKKEMMGGRCSCPSPDQSYEEDCAIVAADANSAREEMPSQQIAAPQSPVRVTKTLFMSSDSEDSSSDDGLATAAATTTRSGRLRCASDDNNNKENAPTGGEFRHRARRSERLQQYAASPVRGRRARSPSKEHPHRVSSHHDASSSTTEQRSPVSHRVVPSSTALWDSPSVLLTSKLGMGLSMKTPPPVVTSARAYTTPGKTGRADVLERELLLQLSVQNSSTFPDISSTDILGTSSWLGEGVSSDVYKVRIGPEDSYYAVKKSKYELRNDRERSLLLKEIKILSKLEASEVNFDHIVRYYQAWQEHGYFYMLLELCEGGTLKEFLASREKRSALPEPCVWYILHQIAGALVVLGAHGIVHLDIKPDNIFITRSGRLKLGDFGTATNVVTDPSRQLEEPEGDAVYMAPELLSSPSRLPSADVFCLGISLLESLLQTLLPADGDEWRELRQGKLPDVPSTYSKKLQLLIAQMMHPNPQRRPIASEIVQQSKDHHIASEGAAVFKEYTRLRSATAAATPVTRGGTRRSLLMSAKTPRKRRISLP